MSVLYLERRFLYSAFGLVQQRMHELRQSPEPNVRIVLRETISVFSVWLVSTADAGSASVSGVELHTLYLDGSTADTLSLS